MKLSGLPLVPLANANHKSYCPVFSVFSVESVEVDFSKNQDLHVLTHKQLLFWH